MQSERHSQLRLWRSNASQHHALKIARPLSLTGNRTSIGLIDFRAISLSATKQSIDWHTCVFKGHTPYF